MVVVPPIVRVALAVNGVGSVKAMGPPPAHSEGSRDSMGVNLLRSAQLKGSQFFEGLLLASWL